MSSNVILYRYDASPFSVKVDNILALKRIPHYRVNVSMTLPRPEITDVLGINYRRIPILAIGNDVYCDTSLIAATLERRFPSSEGYETLFPTRTGTTGSKDTGMIKAFSKFYADDVLFRLVTRQLPWSNFPKSFVEDRNKLAPINIQKTVASQPAGVSTLASHILLVEEQLQDGRKWLFDTVSPSLADISLHFMLSWFKSFKNSREMFTERSYPHTIAWLVRMLSYLDDKKAQNSVSKLSGDKAAHLIGSASFEPTIGIDTAELARLGLEANQTVSVMPQDTGSNYPTVGALVGLNTEEVVLQVQGTAGTLRCHFPRLGFRIVGGICQSKL